MSTIFTTGHSNHTWERFIHMLTQHGVQAIADVRSTPFSRNVPHFNRDLITVSLRRHGIEYLYMGNTLGGRPSRPELFNESGRADYRLMSQTPEFEDGIQSLLSASETHVTAVLCAEQEPADCHRALLVARELHRMGHDVAHILPDRDELLEHHALVSALKQRWNTQDPAEAVDRQAGRAAFQRRGH